MALKNFRASDFAKGPDTSPVGESEESEQEPDSKPDKPGKPEKDLTVPAGTINEVKAWVGDDKEKARAALDAENEKENPRSTLVDWLEGVLEEDDSK